MTTIAIDRVWPDVIHWAHAAALPDAGWGPWAHEVSSWLAQQGVSARDACVLLPFSAHLPLARRAWAHEVGGWLPRIETLRTLAELLGVDDAPGAGALGLDPLTNRLTARAMLSSYGWAKDWARRDARGWAQAVDRLVDTAQQLWRAAAGVAPDARAAYWDRGRALLAQGSGAGARERLLAGLALEWAAAAPAPLSDLVLALRPAAWVVVTSAVPEPAVQAVLARARQRGNAPLLWMDAAPCSLDGADEHGADACAQARPVVWIDRAFDFEDEAQRAAAHVMRALQARVPGAAPVALVAQDRGLVRRVRALLERAAVPVADETGWKLSTTRAGAALMSVLRMARVQASFDDLLDGLKSGWFGPEMAEMDGAGAEDAGLASGLQALETLARRYRWTRAWSVDWPALDAERSPEVRARVQQARALWDRAARMAAELRGSGKGSTLIDGVARWRLALDGVGMLSRLMADDAGAQALVALQLGRVGAFGDDAWSTAARATWIDLEGLIRWADEVLEQVVYMPTPPADAEVVITPLARAVLRPFSAVVWPGADEEHLGEPGVDVSLLPQAVAQALGLLTRAERREQQWRLFALLMAHPGVTLLWRASDGDRPLGRSPLIERWQLIHGEGALVAATDAREVLAVPVAPVCAPQPRLSSGRAVSSGHKKTAACLPARLTATAYESLRSCPYRFYAEVVLGLREDDELEEALDKRDYGTWLHEVLRRFHHDDPPGAAFDIDAELDRLWQAAEAVITEKGWDGVERNAAFLPFKAAFARVAGEYVKWWANERSREGAEVLRMELPVQAEGDELQTLGLTLVGQLDRIDSVRSTDRVAPRVWRIVDYKTTSVAQLKHRVKEPTEDTQLAFYAAMLLMQEKHMPGIEAAYLSIEDRSVTTVPHPDVEHSAQVLQRGLINDMQRIAHGHAMPALGDGQACDYCRCRGLCRRDHWADASAGETR